MSALLGHWKLVLAGCAVAGLAWCWGPGLAADDRPADKKPPVPAGPVDESGKPLPRLYYGTAACATAGCHEKGQKADPPLLCRCDEMDRWNAADKHADAYKVLEGERGKQMLKILGYKDAKAAKECLSCHAVVVADKEKHESFKLEEGVSCVVCHGAYEPWVAQHSLILTRKKFRVLSRQEKEKRYGMTDLWDALSRARLCASCHVGSVAEGPRVVTHDMYAAGHPPLPGFEIASFSNQMPRHWQYLAEKPPAVQKILGYDGVEQEQAKLVLVGAAVSLAESMRLVALQAEACLEAKDDDRKVLDLANFDCWSCHHDLRSPSWRQARGYAGRPGRVPMKAWPAELVRLALVFLGEDDAAFRKQLGEVSSAFVARPYGDTGRIAKSAQALAKWADGLAGRLNAAKVDREQALKLLAKLHEMAGGAADYDAARQVGWAFAAMHQELTGGKKEPEALAGLEKYLGLKLPAGRMKPGEKDGAVVRDLGESLRRLNDYDPGRFRELLRGLAGAAK